MRWSWRGTSTARWVSCARWVVLLIVAVSWRAPAHAQLTAEAPAFTLRDAVTATLARNPQLAVFAYALRAQQARIDAARLAPPLELSLEAENVLTTGAARTAAVGETTLALSRVIELGGKRAARVALAQLAAEGIGVEQQAAQLDALAEVTRRFIHVASEQRHLALTRSGVELARETLEAVQQRVAAAKAPEAELSRAKVDLIRAEIALDHAEHELTTSRSKLAAAWGELRPSFAQVTADLEHLPVLPEFAVLEAALRRNPDFLRFASAARLRDAELRLAQTQLRADLRVTAGVRHLEAFDSQALVLGVSIPFGNRARASTQMAAARAEHAAVEARGEAAFVAARTQLLEVYQELRHSIRQAEAITQRVLPQMRAALSETRYAYERGRYSYLEWSEAQRAYLEQQRNYIEAAASAHLLQAELERLTGEPLDAVQLSEVAP